MIHKTPYLTFNKTSKLSLLPQWVWNYGPVIVWIRGGGGLQGYRGGVHNGSCGTDAAGHFVLVVGYDNRAGKQYWIIKNVSRPCTLCSSQCRAQAPLHPAGCSRSCSYGCTQL